MREVRSKAARVNLRGIPALLAGRVAAGLRQGWNNRTVLLLSLANGIFFAAWAPYWLEWPQYFNDAWHTGIWIVGWYFCLFTLARMAGAEIVVRTVVSTMSAPPDTPDLNGRDQHPRALRLSAIAVALSCMLFAAGLGSRHIWLVTVALFGLNLCFGAVMPLMQTWLNESIAADKRATLLSFNSTFSTIGGSIGLLLGGAVADYGGFGPAWMLAGLISLTAAACFWSLRSSLSTTAASIAPPSS